MEQLRDILKVVVPAIPLAGLAGWMTYGTFSPFSSFWGKVAWHGPATGSALSLTFDDGPELDATPRILDALSEVDVKATFFVIGQNAQKNMGLLRRIDNEGHIVANHTFDHEHYALFRGPWYWRNQIGRTDDLIAQAIGKRPKLFRPPMGITTPQIHAAARRQHAIVTWTRRAIDGVQAETHEILDRLAQTSQSGDILVMHDGIDPQLKEAVNRAPTIAAVRPLVQGLQSRGLRFVRLDEFLGISAYAPV